MPSPPPFVDSWFASLGFHVPPFTSVNHLHLHVQGLPYRSWFREMKYRVIPGSAGYVKGFSWFSEAKQTIQILEQDRRVGVFPC